MIRILYISLSIIVLNWSASVASPLDTLEKLLHDHPQIQEKVYLHTDNTGYFVGDTLWYKAYVVKADNLCPTTMSRLLYVDLLTPDGYLVERQQLNIDSMGGSWGQFVLEDSLYSGYYELRAYTRWQLNFNVTERTYTAADRNRFAEHGMAEEFFRDWEGLYSRVIPVYEKPDSGGDYTRRYMMPRPLQRLPRRAEDRLYVSFYPEGGVLTHDAACRIAFDVKDGEGRAVDVAGWLDDSTKICTEYLGMGAFTMPAGSKVKRVHFTWHDKEYSFRLPEPQAGKASMSYDAERCTLVVRRPREANHAGAVCVSCRGKVAIFVRTDSLPDEFVLNLATDSLPTGVNEITLYDADAVPVASRLFFIDNNDRGRPLYGEYAAKAQPYEHLELGLRTGNAGGTVSLSVAVRDAASDVPSYDDGNILTDMLLCSELRGFVANPAYYFNSKNLQRKQHLDLLMMVQGWGRYSRVEQIHYQPERMLTYEGSVYRLPSWVHVTDTTDFKNKLGKSYVDVWEREEAERITAFDNALQWDASGHFKTNRQIRDEKYKYEFFQLIPKDVQHELDVKRDIADKDISRDLPEQTYGSIRLDKPVLIDMELAKGKDVVKGVQRTKADGSFKFTLPGYEDYAMLFAKAYKIKDSLQYNTPGRDEEWNNERAYPAYYVKRDVPFPHFCSPYSWYQTHEPEQDCLVSEDGDTILLTGRYVLDNVDVSAKQRRGRRGLLHDCPAMVYDVYDIYNMATDNGLMCGVFDMYRFPEAVTTLLLGSTGNAKPFNIRAMMNGTTFYRNYTQGSSEYDKSQTDRYFVETQMQLSHLRNIRIYTDYNLRNGTGAEQENRQADVTIEFEPLPDGYARYTYRDRRYVFPGTAYQAEFYSPDYSRKKPDAPVDHRRTLYWNPNVIIDARNGFSVEFYGNSKPSHIKVSACGIATDGTLYCLP